MEAFPWDMAPTYLVRDNDGAYGQAFIRRLRAMGIRDRPISPQSPWQNPYAERLIWTLDKSRSRKSAQGDKWSFCLTAGTLWPANQERP